MYQAIDVALSLRDRLADSDACATTKICKRTHLFLDFCHNLLKVKIGSGALYLLGRCGKGLLEAGRDPFGLKSFSQDYQSGGEPLTNFFQAVKNQPLKESVGDALEFLTKKACQALVILAIATNILTVINAGIAIAGSIGSAISAGSAGPAAFNLSNDGLLEIASKGVVSIGDSIALAAGGIAQVTTGKLVEGLAHLYGGKDLGGLKSGGSCGIVDDIVVDDSGNSLDLNYFRRLKKIDKTIKVGRNGKNVPIKGEPNSFVSTTGGHKIIYNSEGDVLYDISAKRIKVYVRNKAPNGRMFLYNGSKTKIFKNQVPEKLLKILGIL